jgi:hypothetical protein
MKVVIYDDALNRMRPIESTDVVDGVEKKYTHTQSIPSNTWTIAHNFGEMPVSVNVFVNGREVVANIDRSTETINAVSVTFDSGAYSGSAYARPL